MLYLITGGSGSGKSGYAEDLLRGLCRDQTERLVYVATMFPYGGETKEKIRRHRRMRRDKGFETIECYTDLDSITGELKRYGTAVSVLIECISNLVSNELFFPDSCREKREHDQTGGRMEVQRNGGEEDQIKRREDVVNKILKGAEAVGQTAGNVVIVTNEVNSEGLAYSPVMMDYKQAMGEVNCRLAEMADKVTEVVYGIPLEVKSRL